MGIGGGVPYIYIYIYIHRRRPFDPSPCGVHDEAALPLAAAAGLANQEDGTDDGRASFPSSVRCEYPSACSEIEYAKNHGQRPKCYTLAAI